jgi:hypothetical protein
MIIMKGKRLPLDVLLSVFARVGRGEIMRDEYHLGNCILSTRVTVEVLRHYGVKAKAVSVQTFIGLNNQGNGDGISLGCPGRGKQKRGLWKGFAAGHLIAVIPNKLILIDSSIDQVNGPKGYDRYDRAIYCLPCPFIAHVPAEFVAGLAPACFLVDGHNLMYESEPMPQAVLESAEWRATTRWMPIVNAICRQIDYAKSVSIDEYFEEVGKVLSRSNRHTVKSEVALTPEHTGR